VITGPVITVVTVRFVGWTQMIKNTPSPCRNAPPIQGQLFFRIEPLVELSGYRCQNKGVVLERLAWEVLTHGCCCKQA